MWGLSDEALGAIIGALALVVAAAFQGPKIWKNRKTDILRDLEIYDSLPDESAAKVKLLAHIDAEVLTLSGNGVKTRNPTSAGLGIAFLIVAVLLAYLVLASEQPWFWLITPIVLFFALFGVFGTFEGLTKKHRDATGKAIGS
jgi:hypothetical protein